jgi:hypothetical protein
MTQTNQLTAQLIASCPTRLMEHITANGGPAGAASLLSTGFDKFEIETLRNVSPVKLLSMLNSLLDKEWGANSSQLTLDVARGVQIRVHLEAREYGIPESRFIALMMLYGIVEAVTVGSVG